MDKVTNSQNKTAITLEWDGGGCCPIEWSSFFYNEREDRTYCVYIRGEDTSYSPWSAELFSIVGKDMSRSGFIYTTEGRDKAVRESIHLAFAYVGDGEKVSDDDVFPFVVEDVMIYLGHRFDYLDFQTDIQPYYEEDDPELNQRRIELMKRYLKNQ